MTLGEEARQHGANQVAGDLDGVARILLGQSRGRSVGCVLEVGSEVGGTLWCWAQLATDDALLVSVDLQPFTQEVARPGQTLRFVTGDSHDPETLLRVSEALGPRSVDFLFIDGDHSYESVKSDWEMYSPLVRPGGLAALHDIVSPSAEVSRFWPDLQAQYRTVEIKERPDYMGIGVVYL